MNSYAFYPFYKWGYSHMIFGKFIETAAQQIFHSYMCSLVYNASGVSCSFILHGLYDRSV